MAVTALRPNPKMQFTDSSGNLLSGGKLYTYSAGTTTNLATYTDSTGTTANTNPVILDARGEASVWFQPLNYKLVLKDANDNIIWTQDNYSGSPYPITDEWITYVHTWTFIDATHVSTTGDQTAIYTVNKAIRAECTGGTYYGTITASAYGTVTTLTVDFESGSFDSGVAASSTISVGVQSSESPSLTYANAASASATAAAASATAAASSATAAASSASAASTSASAASTSASAASTSASSASTSASTATTKAGEAATSATNAATSATTATTQAGNASTSATNAASSASAASTSATNAATSETNAAASATSAAASAAKLLGTSTTSLAISVASKTFVTQSGKQFNAGQFVLAVSDAAPSTDWMFGQITSYSGTSLVVNVTAIGGSGTHADWSIYVAGARGATGATGASAAPFDDATALVKGSADATKQLRFEVDGFTAGATRVATVPDRDGTMALQALGSSVASAATVNLDSTTGDLVHITGTTTVTAITLASGISRDVVFDGALTLTHGVSLILPGAANIMTAAGDRATFRGDGTGVVRCMHYTKASGQPVVAPQSGAMTLLSTVTASASATVDIETTFDSTYDAYMLVASGIVPSTDGQVLFARLKVGGAYDSAANYQHHLDQSSASSSSYSGNAGTIGGSLGIRMIGGVGNVGGQHANLTIQIHNVASTTLQKVLTWEGATITTAGGVGKAFGAGFNSSTAALTGIRFYFSSGNIASGTFRLYGINNS